MPRTTKHPASDATPASHPPADRTLSGLAVVTGALWTVGVTLVATQADSDPVGAGYDAANRALTVPLLLLVGFAVMLRATSPARYRGGTLAMVTGSVLLLAGNVLEFWAVLLTDLNTEKTAVRLGESEAFWGSFAGWMVFLLGMLVTIAAAALLGRAISGLRGWGLVALAVVGFSATALWAISPLLTGAAALALAGWLNGLARYLAAPDPTIT